MAVNQFSDSVKTNQLFRNKRFYKTETDGNGAESGKHLRFCIVVGID